MTDIVKPTDIDALPPEPLPTDPPAEFNTKAFNLVAALKNLVNQTNTATANVWNNSKAAHERAVTAGASASDAASSSGLASSRAVEAAASAEQANGYASTAATAAGNANASWSQMQKLYLGVKAAHPVTDNNGQPLQAGASYSNTTDEAWYWWSGSAWVLGRGDPATVAWTNVLGKPTTLSGYGITDAASDAELAEAIGTAVLKTGDQTIAGKKTFTGVPFFDGEIHAMADRKLKIGRQFTAGLPTGTAAWCTICNFGAANVPLYTRFLLTCTNRHFLAEITFSKTTAWAINTTAEIKILGAYQYYYAYPAKFRVVDMGTNLPSRLDFCFPGTVTSTEYFEIYVLEDFVSSDRKLPASDALISYPFTASGVATSAFTPNTLTMGSASGINIARATIRASATYAPIVDGAGASGQTTLETNTAAAG